MKSAKLRIAAVAMAAISSFCAAQAITASAFSYTSRSQYTCEQQSTMNSNVSTWKTSTRFKANKTWTEHVYSSTVVGGYYNSYIPGGYWQGQDLNRNNGQALARALAANYFGTSIFMSFPGGSKEFAPRLGDQVCLTRNGVTKFIFITKDSSGYKAVEQVNGKIVYDRAYGLGNGFMTYGNEIWSVAHFLRPIKEGDANGDSYVFRYSVHNFSGDDSAFQSYIGSSNLGDWGNAKMAACTMNNDWNITDTDYNTWVSQIGTYDDGRMGYGRKYVVSLS